MTTPNTTPKTTTDRIERRIDLKAPRARVWRALTDAKEFGTWFRVALEGPFVAGQTVRGHITFPGYEYLKFEAAVERMEEPDLFTFRWHPYAIDPAADYSKEPTTLVEFHLDEIAGGCRVTVTESGFDRLPPERRDEAFRMNDDGWRQQLENVERHVAS
jgi:uncharacterized protein YndB with AHSA1/START domain